MSFRALEYPHHQFQVAGEIVLGSEQFSVREFGIQIAELGGNLNIRAASGD
jgi:hypothetical protein